MDIDLKHSKRWLDPTDVADFVSEMAEHIDFLESENEKLTNKVEELEGDIENLQNENKELEYRIRDLKEE